MIDHEAIASKLRIGIGHDTHRLGEGGPLLLGGVRIDFSHHLVGHSDADVLLHAIADSLLGAANMGDIGEWFPDTAAENRQRDSQEMLRLIVQRIGEVGFRIVHLDCIVFAEAPKLTPHKLPIRQSLAKILGVPIEAVSVKAKTGEGVDAVGQRVAISAQSIVLLSK